MADKKTIIKAIGAIKTIYNYFGKDTDLELLVNTWDSLLKQYTNDEVDKGVFLALQSCKYAPVPADIIEHIERLRNIKKPCEAELWAAYRKALKEVNYYSYRLDYNYIDASGLSQGEQARLAIEKIWSGLPQELQIYIGDKSELIASAKALNVSEASYERSRFSKVYPLLQKRVEDKKLFLELANNSLLLEAE